MKENIEKLKGENIMKKMTILTMVLTLGFFMGVFSANVEMARAQNPDPDYIDVDTGSQTITVYPSGKDLTAFGSNTAVTPFKLIDANAHFMISGVTPGMYVSNATDTMSNPSAAIISVDSETQLTLSANIFTGPNKLYGISPLLTPNNYALTRDCRNVRWALSNIAPNGTLVLKATDRYGNAHPFHFGTTFASNKGGSAYMTKPVTVRGETGTTITGGYYALNVGTSTVSINGDVTIENIRFDKNGGSALIVLNTSAGSSCYIKNNEFTNNFWETFNQYPGRPSWTDLVARSKLMYNPAFNAWLHYQLTVGVTTIPHGVKGNVIIEGNYFNPEVNIPPDLAPSTPDNPPWWVVYSISTLGTACTCQYTVSNNTIMNPSSRGMHFQDVMGLSTAKGNYIEMGPLNAYLTLPPGPDADPNIPIWAYAELATAISAFYNFAELPRAGCPGRDLSIGGDVILDDNMIVCKGFDQAAIRVGGNTQSSTPYPPVWTPITPYRTFNSMSITRNSITLTDGRSGISLADVGPTPSQPLQSTVSPAMVMHNKIEGSALWGLVIGSTHFAAPRDTDNNVFFANQLSRLQIYTPSEDDYQWWVPGSQNAAHVILYTDTHDNVLVGFSGQDLVDMGTGNQITGSPRSVKGGVGGTISQVMPPIWSGAVSLQEIETE